MNPYNAMQFGFKYFSKNEIIFYFSSKSLIVCASSDIELHIFGQKAGFLEAPRQLALCDTKAQCPLPLLDLLGASVGASENGAPLQSARFLAALLTTLVMR